MTSQALNRPVDVLAHHVRGMRAASEGSGITLTAAACANLAEDLERSCSALAELIGAARELLLDAKIAQANMRNAAKRDNRWEGCAEAIQPSVDDMKHALAQVGGDV